MEAAFAFAVGPIPLSLEIETERLVLRPPRPSDVPALRHHMRKSAEHLRPWSPAPRPGDDPSSITSLSKTVLRHRREWKLGATFPFLMIEKEGGRAVVGRVNLNFVTRASFQNAYLGYGVDVDHVGRGYATEGVGATVAFAFGELKLHRVQAAVMPRNERSLNVLAKLGFRREGLAERYLCINGAWEDHCLLAITRDEWHPTGR